MKKKIQLFWKHLKAGTFQKMWMQTKWISQYARRYWKAMIVYTALGLAGTGVSLISSLISKDLVDIITGHQTGKLLSTFDRVFHCKYSGFAGIRLCVDLYQSESGCGDQE